MRTVSPAWSRPRSTSPSRTDAGPVADCFDDAGDFLARDERQGESREAAAEESDVPGADARAVDPDRVLTTRLLQSRMTIGPQAGDVRPVGGSVASRYASYNRLLVEGRSSHGARHRPDH